MAMRTTLAAEPPGTQVALMVTRRCNMSCGHCSVESDPKVKGEPTEAELLEWVRRSADAGLKLLRFTGGEPMLRAATVMALLRECQKVGIASMLYTNGFWGRQPAKALQQIKAFKRAGLQQLVLSYDKYHAEFMGPDPLLHIVNHCKDVGLSVRVTLTRGTDEDDLTDVMTQIEQVRGARLSVYDLQPVGRARTLPLTLHRAELDGFCSACAAPAITDDGRLIACNGPAYFEPEGSPLVMGSLRDTPLPELIARHRQDPIVDTIRTQGPAALRTALQQLPGFESFPFRAHYGGICDLCHHITRDPQAVAALRARLAQPDRTAARVAIWQVIDANRRAGSLSPAAVNSVGAGRIFLGLALSPKDGFPPATDKILGRGDIDWRALTEYLTACGLSRPLAASLDHPTMVRWAPQFFRDRVRSKAIADGMRELVQRDTLRRIDEGLAEIGATGILLKGAALLFRVPAGMTPRATTDIDVYVEAAAASELRNRLIARGFEGTPTDGASAPQHLAPIFIQGLSIEIHTRLMAPFWGLPEADMMAHPRPVDGFARLATLSPEAMIVHACVHASASFFTLGLKVAWDVMAILNGTPSIDWHTVAAWANRTAAPRAFWVPFRALTEDLGLPIPDAVFAQAPKDAGMTRALFVARHRLLRAAESIYALDVVTKAGLMLLLQHSLRGRLAYLSSKIGWRGARPDTWNAAAGRARRSDILRQAWRQYKRYRRARTRAEYAMQAVD